VPEDPQFTLGTHAARLDAQDKRLESIEEKVDRLIGMAERGRGGIWAFSSIAAVLGAAAGLIVEWIRK